MTLFEFEVGDAFASERGAQQGARVLPVAAVCGELGGVCRQYWLTGGKREERLPMIPEASSGKEVTYDAVSEQRHKAAPPQTPQLEVLELSRKYRLDVLGVRGEE